MHNVYSTYLHGYVSTECTGLNGVCHQSEKLLEKLKSFAFICRIHKHKSLGAVRELTGVLLRCTDFVHYFSITEMDCYIEVLQSFSKIEIRKRLLTERKQDE